MEYMTGKEPNTLATTKVGNISGKNQDKRNEATAATLGSRSLQTNECIHKSSLIPNPRLAPDPVRVNPNAISFMRMHTAHYRVGSIHRQVKVLIQPQRRQQPTFYLDVVRPMRPFSSGGEFFRWCQWERPRACSCAAANARDFLISRVRWPTADIVSFEVEP